MVTDRSEWGEGLHNSFAIDKSARDDHNSVLILQILSITWYSLAAAASGCT